MATLSPVPPIIDKSHPPVGVNNGLAYSTFRSKCIEFSDGKVFDKGRANKRSLYVANGAEIEE